MGQFPLGMLALLVVSVLIYFGLGHRVLDRMHLSDRAALVVIAAIIIGSFIDIPISGRLTINVGGVIPIVLAFYVLGKAGKTYEWVRALVAAAVTGMVLFLAGRVLGADPEDMFIDPIWIYPLIAGAAGYLAGRSRRGAFFAAVIGVASLDVGHMFYLMRTGIPGTVHLGGGGVFDSIVLAGILAVLLAEGVGEILERIQGGPKTEGRPEELLEGLRSPQPARKPVGEGDDKDDE